MRTASAPCLVWQPITYAQLPKGVHDDPGNVADSDLTVAQIAEGNVKMRAVCK